MDCSVLSPIMEAFDSLMPIRIFPSRLLKLDEKESLDPTMSDFEWFGEVFNFNMFNMFSWFYHSLLIFEAIS